MGERRNRQRRRVRCALRCQVLGLSRRPIEARVVRMSEGGLSVVGPLEPDQGDPIRIRMLHHRKTRAIEFSGIVWNVDPARGSLRQAGFHMVGCLVSDPPAAFLELFSQIEQQAGRPLERRIPVVPTRPVESPESERDLPRDREPGPPPKPEREEHLPTFRIRLKQRGGPRTRSISVRARSLGEAETMAREQIASKGAGGPDWELIEVILAS